MKSSNKRSMTSNDKSTSSGDDALTLETGTGSVVTHGVTADTFARSVPTHIIPYYVRDTIFQAWPGMNGARLDLTSNRLPWYAYDPITDQVIESVAGRLIVDCNAAEEWGAGEQDNAFAHYADLPFNPASVARWSFWRFDPLANELDPTMAIEPQAFALDAFSQLFTESAVFHFGYLADIDKEYHRLRNLGPLGRLEEESSEYEAWYHLYHHWRDVIENTYLGNNGLVRLPQHLRDGNWTIADVLAELYDMMTDASGAMHSDLIITGKGYSRGLSGITLGVQDDAAYLDSDGNVRFYHPYMQVAASDLASLSYTYSSPTGTVIRPGDNNLNDEFKDRNQFFTNLSGSVSASAYGQSEIQINGLWNYFAGPDQANTPLLGGDDWMSYQNLTLPVAEAWAPNDNALNNGTVFSNFMNINDLPENGILNGTRYWSGHTLNFAQLVLFAREIGQSIEPQVLETIVFPMGIVGDAAMFVRKPQGATVRHLDEIYNLYEATTSFNENPARLYTGAHLGPTNHMLGYTDGVADLALRGMPITTMLGGELVTAKERYWTPSLLTGNAATQIGAAFFPGAILDVSLYRRLDLEAMAAFDEPKLRALVSRMMGNVTSMRTKVEKPIYLPAGKSGPESVYASGVGMGAIQMAIELVNALGGAAPRFGLGHGGYTDIRVRTVPVVGLGGGGGTQDLPLSRAHAAEGEGHFSLVSVPAGLEEDAQLVTELLPQGSISWNEYADTSLVPSLAAPLGQTAVVAGPPMTIAFSSRAGYDNANTPLLQGAARGRGLFGGLRTPLHTLRSAVHRIPSTQTWGQLITPGAAATPFAVIPDDCVEYVPNGTANAVRPNHTWYEYPTTAVFTRDVGGTPVSFTVPLSNLEGVGRYDPLGSSVIINEQPFTWVDKYLTVDDFVEDLRLINANGTWQAGATTMVESVSGTPADLQIVCPDLSLPELIVKGAEAANITMGDQPGWTNDLTQWDTITVTMATAWGMEYSPSIAPGWPGFPAWDGVDWNAEQLDYIGGSSTDFNIVDMTELTFSTRQATVAEMTHVLPEQLTTVSCMHSSPGMADVRLSLEPLHSNGVAFNYIAAANVVGDGNFVGRRLAVPSTELVGLVGAKVYGLNPSHPRSVSGGTWIHLDVELLLDDRSDIYMDGWAYLNAVTGEDLGTGIIPENNATWPEEAVWTRIAKYQHTTDYTAAQASAFSTRIGFGASLPTSSYRTNNSVVALMPTSADIAASLGVVNHSSGAQLTYIYPDDPKYKMTYRPWRVIADASIAKELRMIFANDGEDVSFAGGPLGIKMIGTPGQFRFADLLDAGQPETFILEPATSKTRLISPSYRSVLTFTKQSLLDPSTQRHALPDVIDELNQGLMGKGTAHISGASGSPVIDRATIREVQLGRQYQRLG